ncbi:MAG: AAA family ATPase [Burkholderiales bacterium]|nr:AAA family ATPase [Burkholderiales bacterium]
MFLLIDEYDAPLDSCLNEPDAFIKVKKSQVNFYSAIKGNSGVFRFLFVTGTLKFGNSGVLSDLNNLDDITLVPFYGDILGFSLSELKHYFGSYITKASKVLNLSESKLIEELVANYNGFCFEETASKKVFAPWSILSFFKRPNRGFINYWPENGGKPSVLMKYVKEHTLIDPSTYSEEKSIYRSGLSVSADSNKFDEKALLVQMDYLTIKKWNREEDTFLLGNPNREVKNFLEHQLTKGLLNAAKALKDEKTP